jgi:glycosyltransferase involved in cell wall biosynthesis
VLVSVVITNYNYSKYLKKCIDSVLNQTYNNIEIIIVDDSSTDDSRDIILKCQELHSNIVFFFNPTNQGVIFSRNKGIELSKGEYICFLDADDFWDFNKIERQLKATINNDFSFCDMYIIDEFNNILSEKIHKSKNNKYNYSLLLKYNFIAHSSLMVKRSILSNTRYREIPKSIFSDLVSSLFSVKKLIHEDYDFLLRVFKFNAPSAIYINENLIYYRKHSNNLSSGWNKKFVSVLFIFYNSLQYNFFISLFFTLRLSFFTYLRKIQKLV